MNQLSKVVKGLLAIGLSFTFASQAFAWGGDGHQTVGAIADQLLAGTPAEKKLQALLLPGETLQTAALWADCAKGFQYCRKALTPEQQTFINNNPQHHGYHYTDVPYELTRYVANTVGTTDHDVVQIIQQSIAALQGNTDASANPHGFSQREAILLLAHLVGDIHQPLHVGAAYLTDGGESKIPTEDDLKSAAVKETQGGNKLHINGTSRVLHGYWDGDAVKTLMRRRTVKKPADLANSLLARDNRPVILPSDLNAAVVSWADESISSAKIAFQGMGIGEHKDSYPGRNGATSDGWDVTLPAAYPKTASYVAAERLLLAGKRLASLLQVSLK